MKLTKITRTRFRITIFVLVVLSLSLPFAIYMQMEGLASAIVTALAGSGIMYKYSETKRPSEKK